MASYLLHSGGDKPALAYFMEADGLPEVIAQIHRKFKTLPHSQYPGPVPSYLLLAEGRRGCSLSGGQLGKR